MPKFPSRFRRLDDILADLAVEDPLLLTELDGYLTGIAVCPQAIEPNEWLPPIWGGGYGEGAPFEDPIDVQLFADMVLARFQEIRRDLARGKPQPIFETDERNGEVLWEEWIGGFSMATSLRPATWSAVAKGADESAAAAMSHIQTLIEVAGDESGLPGVEINALCDGAPMSIPQQMVTLFATRGTKDNVPAEAADRPVKVGRNDPCPCGSGKKYKRCCSAD